MSQIVNDDHSYGSSSLAWEELQTLCDLIAGKISEMDGDIQTQRANLDHQSADLENYKNLLEFVQRQVRAGKMAAEAAVVMLNGHPAARIQSEPASVAS